MLHFAPEAVLTDLLRKRVTDYETADINPRYGSLELDIENIGLPEKSIDLILCSHVLEHVDDLKALREMQRVLTPGGKAMLLFPIVEGWEHTYENAGARSVQDRIRFFGQDDHVRYYGRDVRERITDAGFSLTEFTAVEPDVSRYGLMRGEKIFIAAKPNPSEIDSLTYPG